MIVRAMRRAAPWPCHGGCRPVGASDDGALDRTDLRKALGAEGPVSIEAIEAIEGSNIEPQ